MGTITAPVDSGQPHGRFGTATWIRTQVDSGQPHGFARTWIRDIHGRTWIVDSGHPLRVDSGHPLRVDPGRAWIRAWIRDTHYAHIGTRGSGTPTTHTSRGFGIDSGWIRDSQDGLRTPTRAQRNGRFTKIQDSHYSEGLTEDRVRRQSTWLSPDGRCPRSPTLRTGLRRQIAGRLLNLSVQHIAIGEIRALCTRGKRPLGSRAPR